MRLRFINDKKLRNACVSWVGCTTGRIESRCCVPCRRHGKGSEKLPFGSSKLTIRYSEMSGVPFPTRQATVLLPCMPCAIWEAIRDGLGVDQRLKSLCYCKGVALRIRGRRNGCRTTETWQLYGIPQELCPPCFSMLCQRRFQLGVWHQRAWRSLRGNRETQHMLKDRDKQILAALKRVIERYDIKNCDRKK